MLYVISDWNISHVRLQIYLCLCQEGVNKENLKPYVGVDVRGFHTSIQSKRYPIAFPSDFYDKSFALISKAGMNQTTCAFDREVYEKIPTRL